jgi:nucleoid-associated protein YgaU
MGRYDKLNIQKKTNGLVFHSNLMPYFEAADSDFLIITEEDDRLDTLAFQFYKNASLWWVIAVYNNLTNIDLKLEPGLQLRIPIDPTYVTNKI